MSSIFLLSKFDINRIAAWLFFCASLGVNSSCADTMIEPEFSYVANFNPEQIPAVEEIIRSKAERWGFFIQENDKEQMKFATRGTEAFYIAFFDEVDNIVFSINNVGVGNILSLRSYVAAGVSRDNAKTMVEEVIFDLNRQIGIEFEPND